MEIFSDQMNDGRKRRYNIYALRLVWYPIIFGWIGICLFGMWCGWWVATIPLIGGFLALAMTHRRFYRGTL